MRQAPLRLLLLSMILLAALPLPSNAQDSKENSEFKLAVNLYNDGMYDLAVQQLKNFIDAYPSTANGIEARFYLGLTQLKLKKYEDARFTFQNFALGYVDHPKAPEAWLRVGDAFNALGNTIEAAAAYERVKTFFSKSPLVPDALLSAARLYHRAGDDDRARKMLRTIIEDYPKSAGIYPARLAMTDIFIDGGQSDMAEQEVRHIADSDAPETIKSQALCLLGTVQMNNCLFDEAGKTFQQVLAQYPKTAGATRSAFLYGKVLLGAMKYHEASVQFQAALAGDAPDSVKAEATVLAADASAGEKSYAAALKLYDKVISDFSGSTYLDDAFYKAGETATLKGDYRAAAGYFQKLLGPPKGPLQRKAWIRLAEAYQGAGSGPEAASAYHSFLSRFPGDPSSPVVLSRLGKLYENMLHDARKAADTYAEIVQSYPRSAGADDALIAVGRCKEALHDYDAAAATYAVLLTDYPSSPRCLEIRDRIDYLQHHMIRSRDQAQDKLARLLGDLLMEKPKPQLSGRLADLYFSDLKDYPAAVEQYTSAIDKGLDEKDFIAAYFNRARACDLLSEVDSTAVAKAITYYEAFIKQFPTDALSSTAAYYSVLLRLTHRPDEDLSARVDQLLTSNLEPQYKENLLYRFSTRGITAANHSSRLALIDKLATTFPSSPYAQEALYTAGTWFAAQGNSDSAVVYYQRALEKSRNGYARARSLFALMNDAVQRSDFEKAASYAGSLTSEFPSSSECLRAGHLLPSLLLAAGKPDASLAALTGVTAETNGAIDDNADTLNVLYQQAAALDKKADKEGARKAYRDYLAAHRNSDKAAQAYYALGVLSRNDGRNDLAASYFTQAAAHGGQTGASAEIADMLFQNDQYGEASRQYAELARTATSPDLKNQYQLRAVISTVRNDKLSDAQQLLDGYRRSGGVQRDLESEFQYEAGLYYFRQQNYPLANTAFEKVSDYKDSHAYPWSVYYRAKILEVTNQPDDAAKRYDQILQDYPSSDVVPHVLLSLGNMHYFAERYENAIKFYQTIIEKPALAGDALAPAMDNLIQAYESTKLYDAALKVAKDYIARFPTDESVPDKKIKIGLLYTELGYYDQAVVHFQNLINESGSLLEAELRYNIGEALYEKGDYQQAILEFLKVPYLVSRQGKVNWTATALYKAGQAYEKLSKFPQAMEMYQQIVDRTGIDAAFKAAAKKEITRVKTIVK